MTTSSDGVSFKIEDSEGKDIVIPSQSVPNSKLTYSGIVEKYRDEVQADTQQARGPLFRHYNKQIDKITKLPMGLAIMNRINDMVRNVISKP